LDELSRRRFDKVFEEVLAEMPPRIHELIDEVPLHLEDYPSPQVMREMGVGYRDELCGLYTGIPITEKSIEHSGQLPDVVTLYREGILAAAIDRHGRVSKKRLRREIRVTILHELGHYHGLDEDELRRLGYE
jgi:predicted Zn-dependent protease with MMP-like domain